jgi:uncharacterized membrane protein
VANTAAFAASIEATRRSPKFGIDVDASALVLSATNLALPVAIVTTFGSATSLDPTCHSVPNGMDVTLPEEGDASGMTITFRGGVAPDVHG